LARGVENAPFQFGGRVAPKDFQRRRGLRGISGGTGGKQQTGEQRPGKAGHAAALFHPEAR
jgi:hypothetical protein